MKKVYLIAGHSLSDPGAIAGKTKEATLTRDLRNKISGRLTQLGVDHQVDDDHHKLSQVIRVIKSDMDDLILDIHFNAAANVVGKPVPTGVEVFIPDRPSAKEVQMANQLASLVSNTLGIRSRGVKTPAQSARGTLAILQPAGTNLLLEVAFITNSEDMGRYFAHVDDLATGIAELIATQI